VCAANGTPLCSWRVLILPFFEGTNLYPKFHLDEPWDGPHNKTLLPLMPLPFAPEGEDVQAEPFTTFCQVFVGPGTAFEEGLVLRFPEDLQDRGANTFLVVEGHEAVPWTKPADLVYQPDLPLPSLGGIFKSKGRFSLFGESRRVGFNAAFVDGSVQFVSTPLPEAVLRGMILRNGEEKSGSE
jgi:prepilin-type processing-associated H-X9-DG protein